jgi:hypothetical protein
MKRRKFLRYSVSLLALPSLYARAKELTCDIAVIGGGVGGFAAALAALRNGMRVFLTEETGWIGGQLTAQAVPPDEHPWIEEFGCTRSYRSYRNAVRDYYRNYYPLTEPAHSNSRLNPGNGSVSRLTHEFRVSVAVLEAMLAPYASSGQLVVLLEHAPESATVERDRKPVLRFVTPRMEHPEPSVPSILSTPRNWGNSCLSPGLNSLRARNPAEKPENCMPPRWRSPPTASRLHFVLPWIIWKTKTTQSNVRSNMISGANTFLSSPLHGPTLC